jgi:hypothetical protein
MPEEEKQPEIRKFKLNPDEISNIKFRRSVMDYISMAVNNETGTYIYMNVRPRLGIKEDAMIEVSEDGEWLHEVVEEEKEESKLIIPQGMGITKPPEPKKKPN